MPHRLAAGAPEMLSPDRFRTSKHLLDNPACAFACLRDEGLAARARARIDGAKRDHYWPVG